MQRWKIIIEYNGYGYSGWQRQPDVPSIQTAVEKAINNFCQQDIVIHVAGRTDAGVHAKGQVAHFDLDYGQRKLDGYSLSKAINAHLRPQPISVVFAEKVPNDFNARFSAKNKLYTYRIVNRPSLVSIDRGMVWHHKKKLDVVNMIKASKCLIGHHDFTTFRGAGCQAKSPERTLDKLDIETKKYDDYGGVEIRIHVQGRSFLHHQVRNMVGTLAMVGEGKWAPEQVKEALLAKDRKAGGPTSPPDGLYLMRVDY